MSTREIAVTALLLTIPGEFSPGEEVKFAIGGIFPSPGYSWSRCEVKNLSDFEHEVQGYATYSAQPSVLMRLPFQKEVSLGRLPRGEHLLKYLNGDGTILQRTFVVR